MNDLGTFIAAAAFFAACLTAIILLPIALIILLPAIGLYMYLNSDGYQEKQQHKRTWALYESARHLDIPPPPVLTNSVAGARYRDDVMDLLSGREKPDPLSLDKKRYEHIHMVAGIGHGKTQAMQHFIAEDLAYLGERSIIVIDSQGEMIQNILKLPIPKENIVYINPRDTDYLPALNLFESGEATNATIEIYEYILGGILGAELTSKQGVVFRFVIRLILAIPNSNIDTLLAVFRDHTRFSSYYEEIGGVTLDFFENEFSTNQYRDTKSQVIRRIFTIKENDVLNGMFSSGETRLNLGDEMDQGKLILIDTAKDTLKEEGSRILGRFFIAKLVQAAQERGEYKVPTHAYIDEAQDYFDEKTEVFLSQLRKQKIGGFFAHQFLGQLPKVLQDAFMTNTNTKLVGGVSLKDARAFAGDMKSDPNWIADQPVGTFVTHVKGMPQGIAMSVPFFVMENGPKRDDWDEMIEYQREQYSAKPTPKPEPDEETEPEDGKSYEI